MNYDDALVVLGLTPDSCTLASLKKAYAQAAKSHRPEQDPEGFAQIRLAYERVQEALKYGKFYADESGYEADTARENTQASTLAEDISRTEQLDLSRPAADAFMEQHRLEVLALEEAWQIFLTAFFATETLTEAERGTPQVAALNTALQAQALEHYLSRQAFAEKLGWLFLEEASNWVSLDALKLAMKSFNYELYGWHNQSWAQHSLLETKTDSLREKMIFQLNAQQPDTPEHRLFKPMGLLTFAKLWFFKRKQAADLKKRLHDINKRHAQWAGILDAKQAWRVQHWPTTLVQLLCFLLGLVTVPIVIHIINVILVNTISIDTTAPVLDAAAAEAAKQAALAARSNSFLKALLDVMIIFGGAVIFSLGYMAAYTYIRYALRKHHQNFTKDIVLDTDDNDNNVVNGVNGVNDIADINDANYLNGTAKNNNQTGKAVTLTTPQKIYKWLKKTLTLAFFGDIEGVLLLSILILLPWQVARIFTRSTVEIYVLCSGIVGVFGFMYLRYLSKRQRVLPNHPYLCAGMVSIGFWILRASEGIEAAPALKSATISNPSKWLPLIVLSLLLRSQFPSFIKVDWTQTIPNLVVFNRFTLLEKTAITRLSIISGVCIVLALSLSNVELLRYTPIIGSMLCVLLYVWLVINADMDTPVMTLRAKVVTVIIIFLSLSIKVKFPTMAISGFDWIMSVGVLIAMTWYWAYGASQRYFERWKPLPKTTLPTML
jgi:hypothetical protein